MAVFDLRYIFRYILYFIVDLFDGRLSFNKCLHSKKVTKLRKHEAHTILKFVCVWRLSVLILIIQWYYHKIHNYM